MTNPIANCLVHLSDAANKLTCNNCGYGFAPSADFTTCVAVAKPVVGTWLSKGPAANGEYFPAKKFTTIDYKNFLPTATGVDPNCELLKEGKCASCYLAAGFLLDSDLTCTSVQKILAKDIPSSFTGVNAASIL